MILKRLLKDRKIHRADILINLVYTHDSSSIAPYVDKLC